MGGRQLADRLEDGLGRRHVEQREIVGQRGDVQVARDPGHLENRLDLRREDEPVVVQQVVERLLADSVAGHPERLATLVPQGEDEHAAEALDGFLAPLFPGVHDHFGVGPGPEAMALGLQLGDQRLEVVDLAVERDPDRAVLVREGLLARRQVDDREPPMAEPDVPGSAVDVATQGRVAGDVALRPRARRHAVEEVALLVGTSVRERACHANQHLRIHLVAAAVEDACDPTHGVFPISSSSPG